MTNLVKLTHYKM